MWAYLGVFLIWILGWDGRGLVWDVFGSHFGPREPPGGSIFDQKLYFSTLFHCFIFNKILSSQFGAFWHIYMHIRIHMHMHLHIHMHIHTYMHMNMQIGPNMRGGDFSENEDVKKVPKLYFL